MAVLIKSAKSGLKTSALPLHLALLAIAGIGVAAFQTNAAVARNTGAVGPSFDCSAATTPSELRICQVPELSRLDVELSAAYLAKLAATDPRQALATKAYQRSWIRIRNVCGSRETCLGQIMKNRIVQLGAQSLPAASARPSTPEPGIASSSEPRTAKGEQPPAPQAALIQPVPVTNSMDRPGDEWRGAYTCSGADYYIRLVMTRPLDETASINGTIEFGPTPESSSNRGKFSVTGNFTKPDGALHLEPQHWIHQAAAVDQTFGIDGKRVGDDFLAGNVIGAPQCSSFRIWHHRVSPTANLNGLVLKTSLISDGDCRSYATWLTTGHETNIGSFYLSSLLFDTAGQLRVLGHTRDQWTADDAERYGRLVDFCQRTLSSSALLGDAQLVRQAGLFRISPFDQDPANWILFGWDLVDAAVVLRADDEKQAAGRLLRLSSLPRTLPTLQEYDKEINSVKSPLGNLRYLETGERAVYANQLIDQRQALEVALSSQAKPQVPTSPQITATSQPNPLETLFSMFASGVQNDYLQNSPPQIPTVSDHLARNQAKTSPTGSFDSSDYSDPLFYRSIYEGLGLPPKKALYQSFVILGFVNTIRDIQGCENVLDKYTVSQLAELDIAGFAQQEKRNEEMNDPSTNMGPFSGSSEQYHPSWADDVEIGLKTAKDLNEALQLQQGKGRKDAALFYSQVGCETPNSQKFFLNLAQAIQVELQNISQEMFSVPGSTQER